MNPYLISKSVLSRQVYRYDPAYRCAATVLFCFLLLQIPFLLWLFYEKSTTDQRQAKAQELAAERAKISLEHKALAETEKKFKAIQALTPILRARLPIGAVLGKVEQLVPENLTLSNVTVDAEAFQPCQIENRVFHLPDQIRIVIEGEQSLLADPQEYNHFALALLRSLPPGSKIAGRTIGDSQEHYKTFSITFIAPTNGNYFALGITNLTAPNSL
jgi:hypothetical protein